MKKVLMILMVSAMALFLATGSALAITHVVNDNYNYWPAYEDTYGDEIGYPKVGKMYIDVDENDYLTSVAIEVQVRQTFDWLLINLDGEWDSWDYAVKGTGGSSATMYAVDEEYEYTINNINGRLGHPNGINADDLTVAPLLSSLTYDGDLLTYTFVDESLQILFDEGNRPAIGYTMWCANDVFLTPIPEPATMLLLGSGLIGLAFLGRKKLFKK